MRFTRILAAGITAVVSVAAADPAAAQFFLKSYDTSGPRVTGLEPGIAGQQLPGATPAELRAALLWNLRAGLNVAALQCQFEPTLLTLRNYNALLFDHADELDNGYEALTKYFVRTAANAKAGQTALDQFGTRVYSSFSTVSAQIAFCQAAGEIGQEAAFVPRGYLGEFAEVRMRKLRGALVPYGEQQFSAGVSYAAPARYYEFGNPRCWRRGLWQERRCGAFPSR